MWAGYSIFKICSDDKENYHTSLYTMELIMYKHEIPLQ